MIGLTYHITSRLRGTAAAPDCWYRPFTHGQQLYKKYKIHTNRQNSSVLICLDHHCPESSESGPVLFRSLSNIQPLQSRPNYETGQEELTHTLPWSFHLLTFLRDSGLRAGAAVIPSSR